MAHITNLFAICLVATLFPSDKDCLKAFAKTDKEGNQICSYSTAGGQYPNNSVILRKLSKNTALNDHYKGNPTIFITISPDGKAVLNPQKEGYPSTAELKKLSFEDALMLFGNALEKSDGVKTFSLESHRIGPEHNLYSLDTKFEKGKLVYYRIKGSKISEPCWTKVN